MLQIFLSKRVKCMNRAFFLILATSSILLMQIPMTLADESTSERRSLDTIDATVWPSTCFVESNLYGRPENTVDTEETFSSDRDLLDNIAKLAFGDESRVALFRYCTS